MKRRVFVMNLLPIYLIVFLGVIGAAHFGSQAVTTMVETAPMENRTCFIIDAGHGGIDGGATSCTGILESQFNLQIARRLNDLLRFLGYDTVMVRTTDTSIYTDGTTIASQKASDLRNRVKIVNETSGAILISIHQNTYSDDQYSGAQVFHAEDPVSKSLAEQLQAAFREQLNPGSKRQSKNAQGIYLMQHIDRPGVLIECGFISNPEEEARLRSDEYQKKISCVIGTVVGQFLNM